VFFLWPLHSHQLAPARWLDFLAPLGDATPLRGLLLLLMDPIGLAEQTLLSAEQRHSVVLGWWGMVSTSHF